jgi:hypothetical protein
MALLPAFIRVEIWDISPYLILSNMKKFPSLMILLLAAAMGCDKEIINSPAPAMLNQMGVLRFDDRKHFESTIQPLVNQEDAQLDDFERLLEFKSLRTALEAGEAPQLVDDQGAPVVNSLAFATLLNPAGQIMIGDSLFTVKLDGVYLSLDGEEVMLQVLNQSPYGQAGESALDQRGGLNCPTNFCFPNAVCIDQYNFGGKTYRLRAKFYSDNFFFYMESGIRVRHQRKVPFLFFFYWVNDAVNFIDVKTEACIGAGQMFPATYPVTIAGNPFNYSNYLTSTAVVNHVYNSSAAFNFRQCYWDVIGSFNYRRKDGNISNCTIN